MRRKTEVSRMGATVSVIDEELTRPMDGEDLNCDGVIDIENVRRLRQLLHITFSSDKGDQLSESLNDAALTPSFAREINDLLTKCAGDPGIARLANDKILLFHKWPLTSWPVDRPDEGPAGC